jgi:hypothetical protein
VTKGGTSLPAGSAGYQPRLLPQRRQGRPQPGAAGRFPTLPVSAGAVAAADFDRSGRLGVFIGGRVLPGQVPLGAPSALWANRGGRFEDVTDPLAPAFGRWGW